MAAIQGVVVNHNTSLFTELCLRSFFATHAAAGDVALTVLDNASHDESQSLRKYATDHHIPFLQSGFTLDSVNNTHGEVLRTFILDHPDASYYLLLDADICFLQPNTLVTMQRELDDNPSWFALQARMTINGVDELMGSGWHINVNMPISMRASINDGTLTDHPGLLQPRCHPGCSLIRNSSCFRRVVEHVGLSTAWLFGETQPMRGFYDTFALLCLVMKTHELDYGLSSAMVQHFFSVSYDETGMDWKQKVVHEKLALLRAAQH